MSGILAIPNTVPNKNSALVNTVKYTPAPLSAYKPLLILMFCVHLGASWRTQAQ